MLREMFNKRRAKKAIQLRIAISQNDVAMLRRLLCKGVDPNTPTPYDNSGALVYAVSWSASAEIIQVLLEAGADPQEPMRFGGRDFPLSEAARMAGRTTAIVDLLRAAEAAAEKIHGPRDLFRGSICPIPKFGT